MRLLRPQRPTASKVDTDGEKPIHVFRIGLIEFWKVKRMAITQISSGDETRSTNHYGITETVQEPVDHVLARVIGRASLVHLLPYPVRQRPEAMIIPSDFATIKAKPVSLVKRIERELHRGKRHVWTAIDIIRRFPSQALGLASRRKRMLLRSNKMSCC